MHDNATSEEFLLLAQLEERGIPLDPEVVKSIEDGRRERRELIIRYGRNYSANIVFPVCRYGGTACILDVEVARSLRGKITITGWDLEFPWPLDCPFEWLLDPKEMVPEREFYMLPNGQGFPRDEVLNHHVFERGILTRGSLFRGLLVGYSFSSIPEEFSHGQSIALKLTAFDQLNRAHPQELKAKIHRPVVKTTERKPPRRLFEKRDPPSSLERESVRAGPAPKVEEVPRAIAVARFVADIKALARSRRETRGNVGAKRRRHARKRGAGLSRAVVV